MIGNEDQKTILAAKIREYKENQNDDTLSALVDILKKVDPEGCMHLEKSQCAYEYSMIIEYLIEENS